MGKVRPGNKINSHLNGIWAKHAKKYGKQQSSSKRRTIDKEIIVSESNAETDFIIR